LRQRAAEAACAGPGRAYLLARSLERALGQEVERLATAAAGDALERLAAASVAVRTDEVVQQAVDGPRMLLRAAFLVEAAETEPFLALARELQAVHEPRGVMLELSGPWPPYSFTGDDGGTE
jgi:hypothetical protein